MANWIYNEYKHVGVDYSNSEEADSYDKHHKQFRNYEKEFDEMLGFLSITDSKSMTMIDFGCGTGASTIFAARLFKKVFAVDVSDAMISIAQDKINAEKITNVKFCQNGFLSYVHEDEKAELAVIKHAFHHLPDFWKQIALYRINKMLKPEGLLYLCDIVFHVDPKDIMRNINSWLHNFEKGAGAQMRLEAEAHIREEYSTMDWIIEGMLQKAGFRVQKSRSNDNFITEYSCQKVEEIEFEHILG